MTDYCENMANLVEKTKRQLGYLKPASGKTEQSETGRQSTIMLFNFLCQASAADTAWFISVVAMIRTIRVEFLLFNNIFSNLSDAVIFDLEMVRVTNDIKSLQIRNVNQMLDLPVLGRNQLGSFNMIIGKGSPYKKRTEESKSLAKRSPCKLCRKWFFQAKLRK